MSHEQYRVSPDRVAEQNLGKYNWEQMSPVFLAPVIIVDSELYLEMGDAILEMVRNLANKHDKPLQQVEVVDGASATDLDYKTVLVRWTSSQGVYEREFEVYKTTASKTVLHPRPALIMR